MKLDMIKDAIQKIKRGTFTHIEYATSLPLTAVAKDEGHSVIKYTEKVVRVGVKYSNMEVVKSAPKSGKVMAPWYTWIISDILLKHLNKEEYYLSFVYSNDHAKTKTFYLLDGVPATVYDVRDSGYVIPSYFSKDDEAVAVIQRVKIDNIISLGNIRI